MPRKQTKVAVKQVRGSVLEALGKLSGDKDAEAKGAAQKVEGDAEAHDARLPVETKP